MTMLVFHGRTVGWSPDNDPEWEYDERWGDGGEWRPVINGKLTVLIDDDEVEAGDGEAAEA